MTRSRPSRVLRPALVLAAALVVGVPPAGATAAPPSRADLLRAAHAVERYYASYGTERPIPPPLLPLAAPAPAPRVPSARPAADATVRSGPSWDAAVIAGALVFALAAGLGVLAGRDSMRPRRT